MQSQRQREGPEPQTVETKPSVNVGDVTRVKLSTTGRDDDNNNNLHPPTHNDSLQCFTEENGQPLYTTCDSGLDVEVR